MDEENKEKQVETEKPLMEETIRDGKPGIKMNLEHKDFLKPQRLDGETDHQYQARRLLGNLYVKKRSKGQMIWVSKDIRVPMHEDNDKNKKIIGYSESRGFTYNKEQVKRAVDAYLKELKEKEQLKTNE